MKSVKKQSTIRSDLAYSYFFDEFMPYGYDSHYWAVRGTGGTARLDGGIGGCEAVTASAGYSYETYMGVAGYTVNNLPSFSTRLTIASVSAVSSSFGLNAITPNNSSDYISWSYTNAGHWQANCSAGSSVTSVDTGKTQDYNWHEFQIVATPTVVQFYYDNALVTSITSNITTLALGAFYLVTATGAGSKYIEIDWMEVYSERTNI